jgi:hypothetical protein
MKVRVYKNYRPIKIVFPVKGFTGKEVDGDYEVIDSDDLPSKDTRNYWRWDEDEKRVVVDRAKVNAINDKKASEEATLAGIKSKLGLTDQEWQLLKKLVKK